MTQKTRTILFFFLTFIFLITTPFVLLYSEGYRFDFKNWKFTQTGGIFLKVQPKKVKVFLNKKFVKETDLIFGSFFQENLIPGQYLVEIFKEGFQPWVKTLEIKEKMVTEAKNIILTPENKNLFELLASKIQNVFLSKDNSVAFFLEEKELPSKKKIQEIKLFEIPKRLKTYLISAEDFHSNFELTNLSIAENKEKVLIEGILKESPAFYLLQLNPQPKVISLNSLPKNILKINFNPLNEEELIFMTPKEKEPEKFQLFSFNWRTKIINPFPLIENLLTFATQNQNIFWLNPDGFLFKKDLKTNKEEKLNQEPLPIEEGEVEKQIILGNEDILIKQDQNLFLLQKESGIFEKIDENNKLLAFSPDNKNIALANDFELWIYPKENNENQPQIEKNKKFFLTRYSKKINNLFWLNPYYLIFGAGDEINLIETDLRDYAQIWKLGVFQEPKIWFDSKSNQLIVFANNEFFISKSLKP
jgi:hypothetical protein